MRFLLTSSTLSQLLAFKSDDEIQRDPLEPEGSNWG